MRRLALSSVFSIALAISTLVLAPPANAGTEWCEDDPVFMVNGAIVDVTTALPADAADLVTEVDFELLVPSNVTAAVVSIPSNFPTSATITPSLDPYLGIGSVPIVVNVRVRAIGTFDTVTSITATYATASTGPTGLLAAGDTAVSTVNGQSNVETQVSYSLLGY
jgi:hypothetical protein